MSLPVVGGLLGGILPVAANAAGIGKADTRAKTFAESGLHDPTKFQYGGTPDGANEAAHRYRGLAEGAQGRAAPQAGLVSADYRRANKWDAQSSAARGAQGRAAGLLWNRATGATPSIAGQQAALDMQRAAAAQSSAGASARGAAGMALAQQNAANNTATMQSAISNQAQINAANERMQAERGAFDAFSAMRGGDVNSQAQAAQQAQYAAQLGAQQNQFNAGLQSQTRAQNDAFQLGMTGYETGVRNAQLNAGMQEQGLLANSHTNATNQNVDITKFNANREFDYYNQFGRALTGTATAATSLGGGGGTPQPNTGLGASPTGMGAAGGAQSSSVGIPQPGTGSDDAMKFGMTPLGLLGLGGGGAASGPSSGPARASYDVVNNGGMDVMGSLKAHNDAAMRYQTDPTGGMQSGGLLSDDKAKLRAAYLQGAADVSKRPTLSAEDEVQLMGDLAKQDDYVTRTVAPFPTILGPIPGLVANTVSATDRVGELLARRDAQAARETAARNQEVAAARGQGDADYAEWAAAAGPDGVRRYPGAPADPVTEQFAKGLLPVQFEYREGMGPPGRQTGVRAQLAETQPITSSMITRRPDGLRQIDPQMGLGTALAGVGHLAAKQQEQERKLEGLLALAARREGYGR